MIFSLKTSGLLLANLVAVLAMSFTTGLTAADHQHVARPALAQLTGVWRSAVPEAQADGTYAVREFTFTPEGWEIAYTVAPDAALAQPIFTFRGQGPYELGQPSASVPGAVEATFHFTRKTLTLHPTGVAAAASLGLESLQPGVETDISAAGLSFFPSVAAYDREYDLAQVVCNVLFLGARPKEGFILNVPENRPRALSPGLIRLDKKKAGYRHRQGFKSGKG